MLCEVANLRMPFGLLPPRSFASGVSCFFLIRQLPSTRADAPRATTRAGRYVWSYVVFDEAHRVKNELSLVGQVPI
jgi:hypothetical protein